MYQRLALGKLCLYSVALLSSALFFSVVAAAQVETIDSTARGTSTQMGKIVNVKLVINNYSTPEDRQALVEAFKSGQNTGLAKALEKMKPVGQFQTPGRVGYGLAYVNVTSTPTGRKIQFVTNRKLAFGEVANNTRSTAFNLTAGEININEQDPKQSSGILYPAAQLTINSDGNLQWELNKNPWQLTNIIDWKNKGKD